MKAVENFVGERITPDPASLDPTAMARGEPALPGRFTWRRRQFEVREVLATWKDCGDCRHGSGERYLRRHWFHVRTNDGTEMKLYFERQPGARRAARARWWLYGTIDGQ